MNSYEEIMETAYNTLDQKLYRRTLSYYRKYPQTPFIQTVLFKKADPKNSTSQISIVISETSYIYETDKPVRYWLEMYGKSVHIIGTKINRDDTDFLVVLSAQIVLPKADDWITAERSIEKSDSEPQITEDDYSKYAKIMARLDNTHKSELYKIIKKICPTKNSSIINSEPKVLFYKTEELKALYEVIKPILPANVREEIERCFFISTCTNSNSKCEITNSEKVIFYLLNHDWIGNQKKYDIETIMEKFNALVIGQTKAKETLREELISYNSSTDNHPNILLFVGGEGLGKTHLAETFFTVLGKKYSCFNVAGLDDPIVILGSSRTYDNGRPSEIAQLYFQNACDDGFIFDEIDKATPACINALLNVFDRKLQDNFINVPIDISKLWIIATANDIKNIPPSLLRRVTVVDFVEYSYDEKISIINNVFVPKICTKYDICHDYNSFSPQVCHKIINDYGGGIPITNAEKIINTIFIHAVEKGEEFPHITADNFEEYYSFGGDADIIKTTFVRDYAEIKRKTMVCAKHYPEHIKKRNSELLQMALRGSESQKEYALNALRITANILDEEIKIPDINEVIKELDANHYGLDKPKKAIERELVRRYIAPDSKGKFILLNGCAGVGKTSLARSVANALGRKFLKISLNGITSSDAIKGFPKTYKNSEPGIIAKGLAKEGVCTYAPVILADELDKMVVDKSHDPYTAIYDLLDNQGGFYDNYLETSLKTDRLFIIFTCNDKSRIPAPILDRLEVVDCDGYSAKEKKIIFKKFVLPNTAKQYHLKEINISEKAINILLADYCISYGIRDCERAMENLIESKILMHNMQSIDSITITEEDLYTILGARTMGYNDFPAASRNMYGMARALAVSGNYGSSFGIQIIANEYGKEDIEITGLAKGSFAESIRVAKTLVQNMLHEALPKIHIHVLESGIEKDGPSAGITLFACMMSFMLKKPLPNCAFTGTIDLFGNVGLIGGVKLKLSAAEKAGVETVYIPSENFEQLLLDGDLDMFDALTIKPVCHVREIVNELFKDFDSKLNSNQKQEV